MFRKGQKIYYKLNKDFIQGEVIDPGSTLTTIFFYSNPDKLLKTEPQSTGSYKLLTVSNELIIDYNQYNRIKKIESITDDTKSTD